MTYCLKVQLSSTTARRTSCGSGSSVGIATELRSGRSGDRIPVRARFSAPVQTGPGAHSASCIMGTGSFPGVKSGRGVTLTPHLLLVPWSRKSRAIPLLHLWTVLPIQSLSACTRVHFTCFAYRTAYTAVSLGMNQRGSKHVGNKKLNIAV